VVYGPIYVADWERDLDLVEKILEQDWSVRFLAQFKPITTGAIPRKLLSPDRTLGSGYQMMTPSPGEFTDKTNTCSSRFHNIRSLVFFIKRILPSRAKMAQAN